MQRELRQNAATGPGAEASPGRQLYKLRQHTVEPIFGIIKPALGFRQFLLRGAENVSTEWSLVCLANNLRRLHTLGAGKKLASRVKNPSADPAKPRSRFAHRILGPARSANKQPVRNGPVIC